MLESSRLAADLNSRHTLLMKDQPPGTLAPPTSPALPLKLRYKPKPKGSWKKLFGHMKDCDLYPDALRLGAEWRERMNREG